MKAMIFARSENSVIGVDGKIPWSYPGDLKRFKRLTLNSTIIMGRKTWESIGKKPLPKRCNIVVSASALDEMDRELGPGNCTDVSWETVAGTPLMFARTVRDALGRIDPAYPDVWFIGGSQIYNEALKYVDVVDETLVPQSIVIPTCPCGCAFTLHVYGTGECACGKCEMFRGDVAFAPKLRPEVFEPGEWAVHEEHPALKTRVWLRRGVEMPYGQADNRRLQELGYLTRKREGEEAVPKPKKKDERSVEGSVIDAEFEEKASPGDVMGALGELAGEGILGGLGKAVGLLERYVVAQEKIAAAQENQAESLKSISEAIDRLETRAQETIDKAFHGVR